MKNKWMLMGAAGVTILSVAAGAAARSYNPIKWMNGDSGLTANEQLAAHREMERKLTLQLQALLPLKSTLREACSGFRALDDCVAALHASRNLKIKYNCLKWDMTAARPSGDIKSCEAPPRNKVVSLSKAIHILKPDADAKLEAKSAERRAREDIKDAGS
jgi:hypothetical protein